MNPINSLNSNNDHEVRIMLNRLYGLFMKKFKETMKAWDYFLEFIVIDNSAELIFNIGHNFEWLFNDKRFRDSVLSIYDANLHKSDFYDHLGDMFYEIVKKKTLKQNMPSKIQSLIKRKSSEKNKSITILDPNIGTGRKLMTIHKIDPEATLFGVTKDLNLLRIALINSYIFGIKCFLLNADNKTHEIRLNNKEGINNWKYMNQWNSHINKLQQNLDKSST